MSRTPWYRVVTLRPEVREGRSFSPDEFAIALEQVVAGTAPPDYCDPTQFFSRTCFTQALKNHTGTVLRRLAGETQNAPPVLTLITQFGGGKTHTLTALYHLAKVGPQARYLPGVSELLREAGISKPLRTRVGVFVGNAWDPSPGCETPWIDLARQLAGDSGVAALGSAAKTTPPGTEAITRVFAAAQAPVLLLFDEVLNFVNRHRSCAENFHAFIQNLTVAVTGVPGAATVISLPRSQVEMTDEDFKWQERITKVVHRVSQDLIANDEAEIGEVVRRRLFEDLGDERIRRRVSKTYADWCFERTARLPPEWMAVDSTTKQTKAREFLRGRFEVCYPFHPSTLSVFRRKWSALPQFQQTRGTLAMLAQWVSWAAREQFREARTESLITLGSAPLHEPRFRAAVLGQLGEQRLDVAIDADLAGPNAHVNALDADTRGPLRDIHQRVGTAILFESSGGQVDKVAHLPDLRFALGEPEVETTSIDTASGELEKHGFFIRRVGTDGFRIHHQATLMKVASDRRAALDEEAEIRPAILNLVKEEFTRGANLPLVFFPDDGASVQDTPRLTLVVVDPDLEWMRGGELAEQIVQWTRERGASPRLYPASLIWCAKKEGRELRNRVELWLAWERVSREMDEGSLGSEFDRTNRDEVRSRVRDAKNMAREEVWASYRHLALADAKTESRLKSIDLGAGHSSANETLCGRVLNALRSESLLNESIGAGYLDRKWPPAFKETGAWPLDSLRMSFLNGSLPRLVDPDAVLRRKIVEFVENGDFGLASGEKPDGQFDRVWHREMVSTDEVVFEQSVFLLTKTHREILKPQTPTGSDSEPEVPPDTELPPEHDSDDEPAPGSRGEGHPILLCVSGTVPPELWNRLGTTLIPKLRSGQMPSIRVECSAEVAATMATNIESEIRQVVADLNLDGVMRVECKNTAMHED